MGGTRAVAEAGDEWGGRHFTVIVEAASDILGALPDGEAVVGLGDQRPILAASFVASGV